MNIKRNDEYTLGSTQFELSRIFRAIGKIQKVGGKVRSDLHFHSIYLLLSYIGAILFHDLSPSFAPLEYSIVAEPLRFLGEKLSNTIFLPNSLKLGTNFPSQQYS